MLATLIPLFDNEMAVGAYSIFAQRQNLLLQPNFAGGNRFDGAGSVVGLDIEICVYEREFGAFFKKKKV